MCERSLGWDADALLDWSMSIWASKKTKIICAKRPTLPRPGTPLTSKGHMPGLSGGNVGWLVSQFDITQSSPGTPLTSIGHMSGLWGGKLGRQDGQAGLREKKKWGMCLKSIDKCHQFSEWSAMPAKGKHKVLSILLRMVQTDTAMVLGLNRYKVSKDNPWNYKEQ